jgi:hypothetical protein
MVDDFKQNEDVQSLAKFLILDIVLVTVLAVVFAILFALLSPGSTLIDNVINDIWGYLWALCFLLAFLAGTYGLFMQVASDDSNLIRIISLVYGMMLFTMILSALFVLFTSVGFINPIGIF